MQVRPGLSPTLRVQAVPVVVTHELVNQPVVDGKHTKKRPRLVDTKAEGTNRPWGFDKVRLSSVNEQRAGSS